MPSQKLLGIGGCNIDIDPSLMPPEKARFKKNLITSEDDPSNVGDRQGVKLGVHKPLQSTTVQVYPDDFPNLPGQTVGKLSSDETNEVFVLKWIDGPDDLIYRINGSDDTVDLVYMGPLNFQLDPRYFIGEGQIALKWLYLTDPETGLKVRRTFLQFTDGFNDQRQICVEDSIATKSFSPVLFPYFIGTYDPSLLINFGVPTPNDYIRIDEVPRDVASLSQPNDILFNPWQFRISEADVYGRPSEHGMISELYVPGINDCLASSNLLSACVDLTFPINSPLTNTIQIEYRNGNNDQWYVDNTIFLYQGSNIGEWWTRPRNNDGSFTYNNADNTITYRFCKNKECNPVPTVETDRLENPMPRTSESLFSLGPYTGLANNKDNFNPFSQDLLNKFKVTVIPPDKTDLNLATIDIYVPIFNPFLNNYQAILKDGTNGYIWGDNNNNHGGARNYLQYFKNKAQSGFVGYLIGTGNYVVSTQYFLDGSGNLVEDTTFDGLVNSPRHIVFERFTFTNVPKGTYIFSIASHLSDPTVDANWATTSTTLWGVCPFNGTTKEVTIVNRGTALELEINVCNGNYNTLTEGEILVIADLAAFFPGPSGIGGILQPGAARGTSSKATSGYIYETEENGTNQFPVELIGINNLAGAPGPLTQAFCSRITDRNGFFWFDIQGTGHTTHFKYSYKCQTTDFHFNEGNEGMRSMGNPGTNTSPIYLDQVGVNGPGSTPSLSPDYPSVVCDRILIKGQITLQGSNIGVPNATVALTRGGIGVTDDNGNFTIIAHDNLFPIGNGSTGGFIQPRIDDLIFVPAGCNYTSQTGDCIPVVKITIQPCTNCAQYTVTNPRQLVVQSLVLIALVQRGLLSGGTYGIGVVGWDLLGRCNYVQPITYITIPTIIDTHTIGPCTIQMQVLDGAIFPDWVTRISFFITAETTLETYIDWIVDRVEFIDNTGNVNLDAPTQIRIYYASLNEYNKQNNFNTTTNWQFLAPPVQAGSAQEPFTSDRVQFFVNGDGTFFFSTQALAAYQQAVLNGQTPPNPTLITSLVKYDQTGQYFLIDYTNDLNNLQSNALIRLARPKICSDTITEPYYEICGPLIVKDNSVSSTPFDLDVFDTYYLSRIIPVPSPLNPTTPLNSTTVTTQTTTTNQGNTQTQVVTTIPNEATTNEDRSFGFLFEHNSPSNFWGQGAWSRGRENNKNPYEAELFHQNEIALSGVLSPNGQLNYLNYFDDAQKFTFDSITAKGIVAVLSQNARVLVILETDYFVVGFDDTNVTTDANGDLVAPTAGRKFGNPFSKVGNNYGCQLRDKCTISQYQGLVMYLDGRKQALIRHDYEKAQPVNTNQFDSYLNPKVNFVHQWNINPANKKRYFVGVINKINQEYVLTDFLIGSTTFVNNERRYTIEQGDTISINVRTGVLKGWYSFVAEFYASLEGAYKQTQLYSFTSGTANLHYTTDTNRGYGTIYGTPVNRTLRVVMALDNLKKKKFLAASIYSHTPWFMPFARTEGGQFSRTLLTYLQKADWFFQLPMLCAENTLPDPNNEPATTTNSLTDGDNLLGTWIDATFVGDPAYDTQYTELQGITISVFGDETSSAER